MKDLETTVITVSCENKRCRAFGIPYSITVDGSFVGAFCHPCGIVLARNGYPYTGHRIPAETMARIRKLKIPPGWDGRKRAAALEKLIDRELETES